MAQRVLCSTGSPDQAHLDLDDGDTITVGSPNWERWLDENVSFRFESGVAGDDSFTARRQDRKNGGKFWYAYRKLGGKLRTAYLGKPDELTVEKMLEVATKLASDQISSEVKPQAKSKPSKDTSEVEKLQVEAERMRSQLAAMEDENASLRSQLAAMAVKAGEWHDLAKEAEKLAGDRLQEIERLRTESQNRPATDPEAIALLQNAITPKSKGGSYAANNATGLKKLVEQALALLLPVSN